MKLSFLLGPLGLKIYQYITEKRSMQTVAAVDINEELRNRDLGELAGSARSGILISNSLSDVNNIKEVDVIVLTTSSSLEAIGIQLQEILDYNIPVVSTCEELTFPWKRDKDVASSIDKKAKAHDVAVVSTGVNPGFLMDTLPSMLTAVSKEVHHIEVRRIQDAVTRRIPFQKKIGAGLSVQEFNEKVETGTLRHVGLTESMEFIAESIGWDLDHVEDVISPIIAEKSVTTDAMEISSSKL